MKEITGPLAVYGIKNFTFQRNYPNGEIIILTTSPDFSVFFIEQKLYRHAFAKNYEKFNYLWCIDDLPEIFVPARDYYDIANGVTLIRPKQHYCESSFFSSDAKNQSINNFYMNNIDWLERFVEHFKIQARDLIAQAEQQKLFYPTVELPADFLDRKIQEYSLVQNAAPNPLLNIFTPKEYVCAQYLKQGLTAKEIALLMSVSYRTVEKHTDNLKTKLHCGSKMLLLLVLHKLL
ncbi:MAG: helix-turn-helix transcriptional regulator [Gammaproteobacteria bacterium]|nr:helix-turn-helix transcriptional regulator [Gammaproteobacteria bacterium]